MNKTPTYAVIFIIVISFILLHNSILIGIGNISFLLRIDNKEELDKSVYKYKIENLEKQLLEYEKSYINLKILDSLTYIPGKTVLRNIYDFYDYVMINTDSLVNKGSPVINENGLIGIVEESDEMISKVKLLTKINTSIKVNKSYGIMDEYNKKNNTFVIHNINNYADINIGDEVTTSGLTKITGGIKIGKVINIETRGIERIIYVTPYVNFDDLNYVYVINK